MRYPLFLPPEFKNLMSFESDDLLFSEVIKLSMDKAVLFFESCAEDKTWVKGGGCSFLRRLSSFLNTQHLKKKLPESLVLRLKSSIQSNFLHLQECLEYDVHLIFNEKAFPVLSLCLSPVSHFFETVIKQSSDQKKPLKIPVKSPSEKIIEEMIEFTHTGSIENLWKEFPEEIILLVRQANEWEYPSLEEFAASIFKRYLDLKNVVSYLTLADKNSFLALKNECCQFLNRSRLGLILSPIGVKDLSLELEELSDEGISILKEMGGQITHLVLRGRASLDDRLEALIFKKGHLEFLNLERTEGLSSKLLDSFPDIVELNGSYCSWLDDETLVNITLRSPSLTKLTLIDNPGLTFRSWGSFANLPNLNYLNISYCVNIDDEELTLLVSSSSRLTDFNLSHCIKITDRGLLSIPSQLRHLISLDLSFLPS